VRRPDVLVTGAAGDLGGKLVARLAGSGDGGAIVAADVREVASGKRLDGVRYLTVDVRDPRLAEVVAEHSIEVVVHLAAIVTPGPEDHREVQYSVDVGGTENVIRACVEAGVRRLIVSSSGAAYGYHADHPEWLTEDCPLRGNDEFAYARHKRLVEERLARCREQNPELEQVVFRIGTILGDGVRNQITGLFDRPRLLGVRGGDDRFVFIWDEDVAACLERAITSPVTGTFNLAGDGALSMTELAARMGKRYLRLPAPLLRAALAVARPLGWTRYGPEQVNFLRYRPVLDNARLKEIFGFVPRKTSSEVFDFYLRCRRSRDGEA
jgi:UDP-glucose 4-epimerase